MESLLYNKYESCSGLLEFSEEVLSFLNNIKHDIGSRVLLVGKVGELGKRIRAFGVQVTILEHRNREEICFSHVMNENCTVVSGQLEHMPFNDNYFDKIIVLDYLNHTANCNKSVGEINRVLKHNGEVIVEDLNLKDIKVKLKYFRHRICGDNIHYNYPIEVQDIFKKFNFEGKLKEIENKRYIYIGKKK
ncbi:methyltransferase domain-containing protein [Terrisporobacter glycolicus]|uniref:class I SAM-dependent methyltransferase n=1 Tax=Terrisporobacter petrolearius TaxID=1460447 RepID=UPI0011DD8080